MTYEDFVKLYEFNYQNPEWFFGEFYHIQEQYPQYVDRYLAENFAKETV